MNGNFLIGQLEIGVLIMVVAYHRWLAIYQDTRNQRTLGSNLTKFIKQHPSFLGIDASRIISAICQVGCLRIIRENKIRNSYHFTHTVHTFWSDAIVELSLITHDRVYEDNSTPQSLLLAVIGYHPCLTLTTDKTCGDSIKRETQFFPNRKDTLHIVGGFHNVELTVVQRIRHQCRGHIIDRIAHIT